MKSYRDREGFKSLKSPFQITRYLWLLQHYSRYAIKIVTRFPLFASLRRIDSRDRERG